MTSWLRRRLDLRGRVARAALILAVAGGAALLGLQCGDEGGGPDQTGELVVVPDNAAVALSSYQQFTATRDGHTVSVEWYVNGVRGGTPEDGVITTSGLFIAPAELPAEDRITITARLLADTAVQAEVTLDLVEHPGEAIVVVSPDTTSVLATGSAAFLADVIDCELDSVNWSLARLTLSADHPGSIEDGLYEGPIAAGENFSLVVVAQSVGCNGKFGIAKLMVYAPPRPFDVEMEAFTDSYDVPGSAPIVQESCGGASGGLVVSGLDREGEYIEVPVEIPVSGTYNVTLRFQALPGDTIDSIVSMLDCGTPVPEANFHSTQGVGVG